MPEEIKNDPMRIKKYFKTDDIKEFEFLQGDIAATKLCAQRIHKLEVEDPNYWVYEKKKNNAQNHRSSNYRYSFTMSIESDISEKSQNKALYVEDDRERI